MPPGDVRGRANPTRLVIYSLVPRPPQVLRPTG